MSCPELPTDGPCEAVCARCGRDMHIDLRRLRKIEQRARRMSLQRETVDVAEYILYADDGEEA